MDEARVLTFGIFCNGSHIGVRPKVSFRACDLAITESSGTHTPRQGPWGGENCRSIESNNRDEGEEHGWEGGRVNGRGGERGLKGKPS